MNAGMIVVIGILTAGLTVSNAALVFLVWSGREERRQLVNLVMAKNVAEVRSIESAQAQRARRTTIPTRDRIERQFDPDDHDDRRYQRLEPVGMGNSV